MSFQYNSPNYSFISSNSISINQPSSEDFKNLKNLSSESSKFFCPNCHKTPKIEYIKLPKLNITCNCYNKLPLNLESVKEKFIIDLEDPLDDKYKNFEKYFKCEEHNYTIFQFYCNKCEKNLCQECIKSHCCSEQNDLFDFNKNYNERRQDIKFIDDAFQENNETFLFDNNFNMEDKLEHDLNEENMQIKKVIDNLKIIISTLLYENYTTPNMEIINNINNVKLMLTNDTKIYDKNTDIHQNYEIFSEHEYDYYINEIKINKELVKKIEINGCSFNVKTLENAIFINLEKLILKGNNFSDISPLTTVKFINLKILNLYSNQISDEMIKFIYNFNFPKLESLDLGFNNLKSYELFKSIEHFTQLKKLNLTSNHFNTEIPKDFMMNDLDFPNIEKIDFSNGIFCDKTINIIFPKFKFKKLKSIDLMSNNLHSLDFILNLKNCPLETLILTNNDIDENQLKYLNDFDNLKEINLRNNAIKSIKEVDNIVNILTKKSLEKIIIYGNPIDIYQNQKSQEDFMNDVNEIFNNIYLN